ncbi:hypothetical protein PABG_01477 [Paracoccidioides brasiliensis Pb03]|nr:hypothetical protein PABG_01477 [Paracoccidioides brasiliensis Pb03]
MPSPNQKPFSISLFPASQKKNTPISLPTTKAASETLNRHPRTLHDHDSDNEDNDEQPIAEEVTAFDRDAGGAISAHTRAEKEKQPLVIKVESKNNWQERPWQRKRKAYNLLPREVRAQREAEANAAAGAGGEGSVEVEGPSMKYGLSLVEKPKSDERDGGDVSIVDTGGVDIQMEEKEAEAPKKQLTQDEIALQALIRESRGDGEEAPRRSDLVIPGKRKERDDDEYGDYGVEGEQFDETKSFRADVASRPDPASLADYSAVPVEEFGAALLRGMGWKDGEPIGKGKYGSSNAKPNGPGLKPRIPARRPGYLGIGAKELPGKDKGGASSSEVELGAWGKSSMRKGKKPGEGLYTPVLMRNKKTGEMITQQEFEKLAKERSEGKKGEEGWRERRDRNLMQNGRGRDRRVERDSEDESDDGIDGFESRRRNGSGISGSQDRDRAGDRDRNRDRDRRKRFDDREGVTSDSGRDDWRHKESESDRRNRDRERERGKDRERDRKHRSSGKVYDDDYKSRHSSSSRHGRDSGDPRRDRDKDRDMSSVKDRRDRYDDDDSRRRPKREEAY